MEQYGNIPRPEHPRPQLVRDTWMNLNGTWDFAFDWGVSGEERGMAAGGEYPLKITVPFCPESSLSGICHKDFIPAVWYRRAFMLDGKMCEGRVLLHFGAVDYEAKVWVNGKEAGSHRGGYAAFTLDITAYVNEGENTLTVFAKDDQRGGHQPFGKQSDLYVSHACSYTRTTGIWQTVWLEFVPMAYIRRVKIVPRPLDSRADVEVFTEGAAYGSLVRLKALYHGEPMGEAEAHVTGSTAGMQVLLKEAHLWAPGVPELYDFTVELVPPTGRPDRAEGYFGLRSVELSERALCINGSPVFMRTVLDQGFHPKGIYTFPSDDAIRRDIELCMDLGFNGARLHQRVFEDRALYWADHLGYLVWSEYASGGDLGSAQGLEDFLPEWAQVLEAEYNHPAIIGWCAFNETYHEAALDPEVHRMTYAATKVLDPTRPVIDASGGVHFDTDMFDVHDYEQDPAAFAAYFEPMKDDPGFAHDPVPRYRGRAPEYFNAYKGQPYWVSEYGGTFWNPDIEGGWGYGDTPGSEEEFAARYEGLTAVLLRHERICGFCYTQLTDIEQEQNGLYRYDRSRKHPDWVYDRIRKANLEIAAVEKA